MINLISIGLISENYLLNLIFLIVGWFCFFNKSFSQSWLHGKYIVGLLILFSFLIGKKKYIKKTTRCKIAPAEQNYKKEEKTKTKKSINTKKMRAKE